MEFTFVTQYDQKAVSTMAKVLRKAARRKRSRRSHIFGWIVMILAVLLVLPTGDKPFEWSARTIFTMLVTLILFVVLVFEDAINGYIARKRMMAGMSKSEAVFREENYSSSVEIGKSEWEYKNIGMLAECGDYFVFIFDKSHAQVYDKRNMSGGTPEEFAAFISEKTGKNMVKI